MGKYRYYTAVRQINDMACWAACLKWWYKTAMGIGASQDALWQLYSGRATQQGGMPDADMKFIIGQNGMQLIEYANATAFTYREVQALLECGPIFTAFTESATSKRHVNVIYEIAGDESFSEVRVMEPQYMLGGGKWDGRHEKKALSDFNMLGSVWTGVHRERYKKWSSFE